MARRILVPLDRSSVAESVLPLVGDLARGAGAAVRLLHVAPVPGNLVAKDGRVVVYADQEMQRIENEGLDYLRKLEVGLAGVPVDAVVRFGEPLAELLAEAEAFGADLVAVTTTGRSGLARTLLGSVAEQVVRRARLPVLLYRPIPA